MEGYTPDAKLFQDFWKLPENPFPFLGADEYPEEQILSLFEIDRDSTIKAFSLQNSIIEGGNEGSVQEFRNHSFIGVIHKKVGPF